MRKWIHLALISVALISLHVATFGPVQAQGSWPPLRVSLQPALTGDSITFEMKVTNLVDWTLVDFTMKGSIPPGTQFVSAQADFNGAVVEFDGQDASFFVITLPAGATIGFRYTVKATEPIENIRQPQLWIGWKGRLPGQTLFDFRDLPVRPPADADNLDQNEPGLGTPLLDELKVVHVYGSPFEQGFNRGSALAAEIQEQVETHLEVILPQAYNGHRGKWLEAIHNLLSQIDMAVVEELQGMAEGSGVALEDLELVNFSSYVAPVDLSAGGFIGSSVLVTLDTANRDSRLIIGRHQDLAPLTPPPLFLVRHFTDMRPARIDLVQPALLEPYISVTESGLFWGGHTVSSREAIPARGTDLISLLYQALRQARTLDDLQTGLLAQPRLKPMNMVIANLSQGEARRLEVSTTRQAIIRPNTNRILVGTNHLTSPDLSDVQPPPVNRSATRYERLTSLALSQLGRITPQVVRDFVTDPNVAERHGFALVIDAGTRTIAYWLATNARWSEVPLASLFADPQPKGGESAPKP